MKPVCDSQIQQPMRHPRPLLQSCRNDPSLTEADSLSRRPCRSVFPKAVRRRWRLGDLGQAPGFCWKESQHERRSIFFRSKLAPTLPIKIMYWLVDGAEPNQDRVPQPRALVSCRAMQLPAISLSSLALTFRKNPASVVSLLFPLLSYFSLPSCTLVNISTGTCSFH